jgi:N-methylhydantoinase B
VTAQPNSSARWQRRIKSLQTGYLPPAELDVNPDLLFHADFEREVDPITFEVIRSRFWNINWDHQETIRRVSGSGVVVYGYDFNTSLQTETGEGVVFGPGNLMFAGCADLVIKWTLEHRSWSVGINHGDVFIQDDPWVGTNHAMDTAVYAPIFIEDRLFCWVYNVVHQRELGGVEPGGFVQTATDVYFESTFFPPTKLVDRGVLREDVAEAWVRRSRLPELILLELKSQLAGADFAARRIDDLVQRYGAATVKGVMRKMIRDTASVVGARLETLPDGIWRDVRHVGGALPGDRRAHRFEVSVRKEGGKLHVSNEGTELSTGSFNITAGQWRACFLNAAIPLLAYDQYLCGAGVLECIDFDFAEGAITSARHPAAISTSMGTIVSITQCQHVLAKMLTASPALREHVFAASGLHTCVLNFMFGLNAAGLPYGNFPFDGVVGAIGAFATRDGLDHGGAISSTINPVGSVESWEQQIPFLYLYRREVPYSGGHGKWRGGATFVTGWTGHKTSESYISSGGLFQAVTLGIGLVGGLPATGGSMWHATETAIGEEFAAGRLPATPEELRTLAPHGAPPPPKKFDNPLRTGDLFEVMPSPGAGYGDPLLRDAQLVAADVGRGAASAEQAEELYGVVRAGDAPDPDATAARRAELRQARLGRAEAPLEPQPVPEGRTTHVANVLETVAIRAGGDGTRFLACAACEAPLGAAFGNYRDGAAVLRVRLPEIDSRIFQDPRTQVDDDLLLHLYLCPNCGLTLDTALCSVGAAREWDVRLADDPKGDR